MSDSSQAQAESSTATPSNQPLTINTEANRTSSPSSLEHHSSAAWPTDSPTRDVKGKGKAVEVTDVTDDTEGDISSATSTPTVVGIEPEEMLNMNDTPLIFERTESEGPLENESSVAEAEPQKQVEETKPPVAKTEWKEESSENKAYLEGYNGLPGPEGKLSCGQNGPVNPELNRGAKSGREARRSRGPRAEATSDVTLQSKKRVTAALEVAENAIKPQTDPSHRS
ncbi:uncharacterized protein PAC_12002 [Phialocephala subalpina]|uniref:Uncharacterized protein n=1 Tax=Phialocephala subalpina TaxID=576137 RepID=A0A1L7XAR4_9HELO|nr:uncharacterized protein PAC_12002 [Phialocephala subalpina]